MTRRKQPQRTLWEGILVEDVKALWEPWMVEADNLLDDEELIDRVFDAQGDRLAQSRSEVARKHLLKSCCGCCC